MPHYTMNDPAPAGRMLSTVVSLVMPGGGQFYQGDARSGFLYFGIAVTCWVAVVALLHFIPALPLWLSLFGLAGHVLAAVDAARLRPAAPPPNQRSRRLP